MGSRILKSFVVVALCAALLSFSWAHVLLVTTPSGKVHGGWVGALDLPGQGKGLVAGGPDGSWMMSPSHAKGLNAACEATEGNGVVDIRGPGGPGCPHGQ